MSFPIPEIWKDVKGYEGKYKHLGLFKDKEGAYEAYYNAYLEIYGAAPWSEEL